MAERIVPEGRHRRSEGRCRADRPAGLHPRGAGRRIEAGASEQVHRPPLPQSPGRDAGVLRQGERGCRSGRVHRPGLPGGRRRHDIPLPELAGKDLQNRPRGHTGSRRGPGDRAEGEQAGHREHGDPCPAPGRGGKTRPGQQRRDHPARHAELRRQRAGDDRRGQQRAPPFVVPERAPRAGDRPGQGGQTPACLQEGAVAAASAPPPKKAYIVEVIKGNKRTEEKVD